jgi:hypothetical protein
MLGDILTHLRESINSRFRAQVAGNSLTLTEPNPAATCNEIIFNTTGVQPILVNLDQDGLHPLLSPNVPGLQQRSDYLLICPTDEALYFLVIEIKSNTPRSWRQQCAAGECLATYIISTIERVHNVDIKRHVRFRHILFTSHQQFISKNKLERGAFYKDDPRGYTPYIEKTCKNKDPYNLKLFLV